jgi:hypothetical protein
MKATQINGDLAPIPNCDIVVPTSRGQHLIPMRILPEISDSKSATYQDEQVIGRSFPIKTYSHGENRSITMKVHFVILKSRDAFDNIQHLRALQSAVYPRESNSSPYLPPPICKIRCGHLLSSEYLCVVLRQYNVTFDTTVAWFEGSADNNFIGPLQTDTYLPYKFDVDLTWEVVYQTKNLPGQDKIFGDL